MRPECRWERERGGGRKRERWREGARAKKGEAGREKRKPERVII